MSTLLIILCSLSTSAAIAQTLDPATTVINGPAPPVVTPGETADAPPSDAIVLFDGRALTAWESVDGGAPGWTVANGAVTVVPGAANIRTLERFADIQLHIEWRAPPAQVHSGNLRSPIADRLRDAVEAELGMHQYMVNSGVFLQERYEVQVLETYGARPYVNGQAGAVYKQHIPLVTASRTPGEWQTYDIIFQAPRFGANNTVVVPARLTVLHNGVLIHNNVTVWGPTEFRGLPNYESHGAAPIVLQSHAAVSQVSYRNIWVRRL